MTRLRHFAVIASTVLVAACAASGTHYADLTGEVLFVRDMIDAHCRRGGKALVLQPTEPAAPATLEHFLAERYCLYTQCRGQLLRGDIEHAPWQLAPAKVDIHQLDMTQLLAHSLSTPPTSALTAQPLTVTAKELVGC